MPQNRTRVSCSNQTCGSAWHWSDSDQLQLCRRGGSSRAENAARHAGSALTTSHRSLSDRYAEDEDAGDSPERLPPHAQEWRGEAVKAVLRSRDQVSEAMRAGSLDRSDPNVESHQRLIGELGEMVADPESSRDDFERIHADLRGLNTQLGANLAGVATGAIRQIDAARIPVDRSRGPYPTVAAFKRDVKVGDRLHRLGAKNDVNGRLTGEIRAITSITSQGVIFENTENPGQPGSMLEWPKAAEFSCPEEGVFVIDHSIPDSSGNDRSYGNRMIYGFTASD